MPVNKTEAEKHREVQDRAAYRRLCSICVREFYDSLVGPCPERDGRQVCMYCCRMCAEHYTVPGQIGQRCRAKDRAREEKRGGRGTNAPSVAARQLLPGGSRGRERDRCGGDEGRKEMTA